MGGSALAEKGLHEVCPWVAKRVVAQSGRHVFARKGPVGVARDDPVGPPAQTLDRSQRSVIARAKRGEQIRERVFALSANDEVHVVAVERDLGI